MIRCTTEHLMKEHTELYMSCIILSDIFETGAALYYTTTNYNERWYILLPGTKMRLSSSEVRRHAQTQIWTYNQQRPNHICHVNATTI